MALPDALLGSNLKAYFDQGYNASTGTFVDAKGNATSFTQATAANRPTWNTSTAPSGRGLLACDGTNDHINGGNIPTGVLPAWSGSSVQWVEFGIFVRGHTGTTLEIMVGYEDVDYLALVSGGTYRFGCYGDNVIGSGTVERWIAVHDPQVGFVATLVNGVVQGDTETPNSSIRTQWVGPKSLGGQSNGASPFNGLLGCVGYAVFTSRIEITDLYALDAAMQEWWTTAPSGGGSTVTFAGAAAGAATTSAAIRVGRKLAASAAGIATPAMAMRVARPIAGSAAGVATTTAVAAVSRRLAGSTSGVASTTLSLGALRALAGNSAGAATTTAPLGVTRGLAGSAAGVATTTATVRVRRGLAGTASGVASTALALTVSSVSVVLFAGTSSGGATTSAALSVARRFDASAQAGATTAAAVRVTRAFGGASAAGAIADARLSVVRSFVATASGFATTTMDLSLGGESGIPAGVATVVAFVTVARAVALHTEANVRAILSASQAVVIERGDQS